MTTESSTTRSRWLRALKWAVVVAVCVAVSRTFRSAVANLDDYDWQMDVRWLVAAGGLYLAAWFPMAWFWWRTLAALGSRPSRFVVLYAYFLGHLGKYVPGKVLVLVIRVGLLRPWLVSLRLGVASVLLETLTLMSVGAVLAAVLAAYALQLETRIALLAVLTALVVGLPTLPPVARRLIKRLTANRRIDDTLPEINGNALDTLQHGITLRVLAQGWFASALCWVLLGWSLWATLRGIGVEHVDALGRLPLLVAAVSLSVVAGFVSMLPGGLVVRDALVMQLLSPICGETDALVAAVLWRLVSLLSELAICGILEIIKRSRNA